MNSEVKKRKKRFWAFCLAFVLLLGNVMPMSVLAAEYDFDNLTMNSTEIGKVNIVYPGDSIVIPSLLSSYKLDYINKQGQIEKKGAAGSSFVVETYEKVFGESKEGTCWKIEGKGYSCGIAYLRLVACPNPQFYTKSDINYELYGGVNATSNPSTYYEGWEEIPLADASKVGYTFGGWYSDAAFTTKMTSIPVTQTGDVTLYAKFTPNLISITNPQNITGVANGTAKTAAALGLPQKVAIITEDGNSTADVTWNLTNLASGTYDPSVLTEQTFTVDGDVTLPSDIGNDSNIPLKSSVQVTVVAAGFVSEPTANPAEGTYTSNQSVTLTSSTEGAKIYYTTDGSEPTLSGGVPSGTTKAYTAPIDVTGTEGQSVQTTIKAIAVKDRMQDSGVKTFNYTIQIPDTTAPTAEIQIDGDRWTSFRNTIDFRYFFKNSESVSITASDSVTANPVIQYYLSDKGLSQTEAHSDSISWTDYESAFSINANSKKIVYAKVTDDAGNTTIINSDGVVVYTDSAQADTDITCTRLSGEDKSFAVTLNGNTIDQVTISSTANASLTQPVKDTDYTIADNQVTLKGAYLDTLPAGDYTITISYHPMGVPYQERQNSAGYDPNDEPATTTVNLKVEKIAGTVSVTGNPGKTYDGTPVSVNFDRNNNAGDVVVEYKAQGAADSSYHTTAPKNAGNYTVRITVEADAAGNYTEAAATKDFSITPKELTVDVAVADKQYDGLATAEISGNPVLSGVISGDDVSLTNGTAAFTKVAAGENIPVTCTDFSITGADAANYKLLQPTGVTASIYNSYHAAQNTDYTVNSNDWINEDFVVTAKTGFELSKTNTADGTWSSTLSATEETADGSLAFYVRNKATGAISNPVAENYKIDKTVPSAEINVGTNSWNQFWNTVTFGHFFKNTKSVTITASDNMPAAPTIEYLLADHEFTKDQLTTGVTWTDYTGAFGINANSKKIVYAKVTDEAGNTIIVNSAGIVVYTDSASDTTEITYVKNVTGDVNVKVTLNGNTVAGIQNGSNALTDGTDYTVDADGKITFKEAYLKTLAAGTYTLTVSYDPMGESYVQGNENEAANTTELVLTVRVMESAAENEKNENVPFINGKNGREGWDAIRDEVGNTKAGDTITVDMNGTTVVLGDIFRDIKGKDITIVFDMGDGMRWSVNGKSVTGNQPGEIDFAVTTGTTNIPVDVINKVTGERVSMQISLKHEGEFGFAATLTINLEPKNKGLYANLFYFNPKAEKGPELEFICGDKIDKKGYADLVFNHASDYTIVIDKKPMQPQSAPKKGTLLTDRKTKMVYKVTKSGKTGGTVQFVKTRNTKAKTIAIPDKVTIDGITYKVTSIAANALKNNKAVTRVTIGKYVTSIGSRAFYKCINLTSITIPSKVTKIGDYAFRGCSKLKSIRLRTTLLTTKTVSEKAFSGISISAVIKVPKSKLKSYKKLFVKKGLSKKVTIRNL
ncbi:MAG: X2-like carbohydrate binding domain-containing protein [Agathobacter sp.]